MMKTTKLLTPVGLAFLLAACGGGGGSTDGTTALMPGAGASAPTGTGNGTALGGSAGAGNTGSVSAPFAVGSTSRYMMLSGSSQVFGPLNTAVQNASGAMTSLVDTVLSGAATVKEIAGDANFAQGRWAAGTVTSKSGNRTLSGSDAYHYLAFNPLATFPTTGSATCDAGNFTLPTYVGAGSTALATGIGSGNAAISFGSGGATLSGKLNVTAGSSSGSHSFNTVLTSPGATNMTGTMLSGGPGALVSLGSTGSSSYLVVAGYSVALSDGTRYLGMASFHCK